MDGGGRSTLSVDSFANRPNVQAVHLALEICIVALPWYELRRLNRAKAERIALAAMFSSGILVCIASLVQLVLATQLNTTSEELWWINTPQAIASVVEINLAHFSSKQSYA
ncbi:hypothetical protein SLS60_006400 [Paraconiothyrium brasiliense]|uniref:Rhodopsin domain-containing protein n=1 Tax=Paraconiothyrium brasiliense TaxID=300254 RepID=A0ABR3RAN0_9PLEO